MRIPPKLPIEFLAIHLKLKGDYSDLMILLLIDLSLVTVSITKSEEQEIIAFFIRALLEGEPNPFIFQERTFILH